MGEAIELLQRCGESLHGEAVRAKTRATNKV